MGKLIRAHELKMAMFSSIHNDDDRITAMKLIDEAPEVDAEQVIRCGDCAYCHKLGDGSLWYCGKHILSNIQPYMFCYWGEYKE